MEGRRFGRYVLESQIGLGGMGVVYVAQDTHLGRQVALKVVARQYADNPEFRTRFQREAATLARLDSPHVIAIYDHGEEDGLPWLAAQYVRGGDLGFLLADRGALAPATAISVCAQLAEALTDAHRVGVIHRDIKPSNVLVRDRDAERLHVYLCDFGIALDQSSERLTTAGGVVGTWAYLAPERSQGEPATPASDVYSLGCLLWVCLTGEAPYVGTDVTVAMAHVNAPVRQLAGPDPLSQHLNQVLARTMAKDPAHRYPSAADLHRALLAAPAPSARVVPRPMPPTGPPPSGPPRSTAPETRPVAPPPSAPPPPSYYPPPPPAWTPGPPPRPAPSRRGPVLAVGAAVLAALIVVVTLVIATASDDVDVSGKGTTSPTRSEEADEPSATELPGDAAPADDGPVTYDVTGDGLGDAVAYYQDGDAYSTFTYASTGSTFDLKRRRLKDFEFPIYMDANGDERLDSVEPYPSSGGRLSMNSSVAALDGTSYPGVKVLTKFFYVDAFSGDFDGDGNADLAVWGQTARLQITVWVLRGNGSGRFEDPEVWTRINGQHSYTTFLRSGDFDGDGATDLLADLPDGTPEVDSYGASWEGARGLQLYRSTGDGFSAESTLDVRPELKDANTVIGDFAGDGTPLVAISTAESSTVSVFEVGSGGGLTARPEYDVGLPDGGSYYSAGRIASSDVDGDRDDDLVITKKTSESTFTAVFVAESEGGAFLDPQSWGGTPRCDETTPCIFSWFLGA